MKEINESIADDIQNLIEIVRMQREAFATPEVPLKHIQAATDRVESWLATFQPNHLDEKDMLH